MLNSIALTFHLTASTNYVSNISVPQYNVTMTKGLLGHDRFGSLQKGGDQTFSGKMRPPYRC